MTLAATQEQAVLARRKEIEDKRRFKLHDKSYKVGVDTAALSSQIADKQASRLEEAASDAAFDEMRLNVDKHLMYVDQQRDAYLRERDVAVDEFRRTQQKKGESRDADLNDPDALKKDRAPVGDDISVSSFQKFAGEDTHYAERVRLQQAQLREWAAAQAAEKRQKAEAERQTDAMWANHMLEADLMRCEYAEKEGHIYRQRVAELAENNLAQLEFKRALQKEEDLRAEMDNATEIQAQLNSSWLGEDPNLTRSFLHPHRCAHRPSEAREPRRARPASLSRLRPRRPLPAPSARCRRARPDHFKGYTAEQKQAVVLELAQQVEARKAAEAEERELDKRVDDMTMHWNRIATLREHEVGASGRLARSAAARPALPLPPGSHLPSSPPAAWRCCAGGAEARRDAQAARGGERGGGQGEQDALLDALRRGLRQQGRRRLLQGVRYVGALTRALPAVAPFGAPWLDGDQFYDSSDCHTASGARSSFTFVVCSNIESRSSRAASGNSQDLGFALRRRVRVVAGRHRWPGLLLARRRLCDAQCILQLARLALHAALVVRFDLLQRGLALLARPGQHLRSLPLSCQVRLLVAVREALEKLAGRAHERERLRTTVVQPSLLHLLDRRPPARLEQQCLHALCAEQPRDFWVRRPEAPVLALVRRAGDVCKHLLERAHRRDARLRIKVLAVPDDLQAAAHLAHAVVALRKQIGPVRHHYYVLRPASVAGRR